MSSEGDGGADRIRFLCVAILWSDIRSFRLFQTSLYRSDILRCGVVFDVMVPLRLEFHDRVVLGIDYGMLT